MRGDLDRHHVGFQHDEPENATYLIERLVGIYETMLRDFVVRGVPPNVGSRDHVEPHFAGLCEEQRDKLIAFGRLRA